MGCGALRPTPLTQGEEPDPPSTSPCQLSHHQQHPNNPFITPSTQTTHKNPKCQDVDVPRPLSTHEAQQICLSVCLGQHTFMGLILFPGWRLALCVTVWVWGAPVGWKGSPKKGETRNARI